jgi:single-strand DNA-binding protein
MAGEINTTLVGNLTGNPEMRFTPSGAAVCNFTIACTPRHLDRSTDKWVDGDTTFVRVTVWRQPAENVVESLQVGDRVVCTGRLNNRPFDWRPAGAAPDAEPEKRRSLELEADEVAASLRFRTVRIVRPARDSDVEREAERTAATESSKTTKSSAHAAA